MVCHIFIRMKTSTINLIIIITLFTANSYSQVSLTFSNKSSSTIDSIVIKVKKNIKIERIEAGLTKTVFVGVDQANFHSFVPFSFFVYSPTLNTEMQWQKTGFSDTIDFYDHGVEKYGKEPRRPEKFWLYVINNTSEKIDTIYAANNAIKYTEESTPRSIKVVLDHKQAEIDKRVYIKAGQKLYTANLLDWKFNDWNEVHGISYIYDDSILTQRRKNAKQFEFEIVFDIRDELSWKKVQIKSRHLQKIYIDNNGKTIRAVFDHAGFIAEPEFEVKIGKKIHQINLREKEFDAESNFQLFSIYKNRILQD
jgi:hypothetical protein